MPSSLSEITAITIILSTLLLLLFGSIIIYFIFRYQAKRFRFENEVLGLREAFGKTLLQSKLEIQEQTLDHISKELHANFSHLVSLININLSAILPQSTHEMKESIIETKSLAKQLLGELKALSSSLNTDHIMKIGFEKALKIEMTRMAKTKRFQVEIIKQGEEYAISPERSIILFRITQEILNNIVKYSKANTIIASTHYHPETFQLEIADNGIGFDMEKAMSESAEKSSTGIANIQKRAKLIGASAIFTSIENKGTTVRIILPKNA